MPSSWRGAGRAAYLLAMERKDVFEKAAHAVRKTHAKGGARAHTVQSRARLVKPLCCLILSALMGGDHMGDDEVEFEHRRPHRLRVWAVGTHQVFRHGPQGGQIPV